MSKEKSKRTDKVAPKTPVAKEIPVKNIVEKEQFDSDGNLVCPTCKKR